MKMDLNTFLGAPVFSEIDRRFARFLVAKGASDVTGVAAALTSYQLRRGKVFLDLTRSPVWDDPTEAPLAEWPGIEAWKATLSGESAVGTPGDSRPLILTKSGKLYLQRYWVYEKMLAAKLEERAAVTDDALRGEVHSRLDRVFQDAPEQKQAAINALARPFSLISGGPGTGKTTTVLKILVLLLERDPDLAVQLVAPTGKAATRLQESIRAGLEKIDCPEAIRRRLEAQQASTVHRLLGSVPGSVFFRHHAKNPLAADLVVLDEASMVDLPLMAKLFDAIPATCRMIMLGDADQLASVEAGSVLSGIVDAAVSGETGEEAPLKGVATLLKRNYRFGNESGIFRICNAVREGDAAKAGEIFREAGRSETRWRELPAAGELKERLRPRVVEAYSKIGDRMDPREALEAFGRFQILTALRQGPFGKENVNRLVEEILREDGLVSSVKRDFPGRPLMVTENDYALRLFNGDVGVLLEDEDQKVMAFFRNEDGTIRKVSPMRLPFAEPAFAMTVHKSQGSEFNEVLVVLPPRDTPVLTRELLYTAISRAKRKVELWCSEEILKTAVSRKLSRGSGLREMLVEGR